MKQAEESHSLSDSQEKPLSKIILYDGVCNLCWFWVQFILKHDHKRLFNFVPLQSQTAKNIMLENKLHVVELSTVVLIDDGRVLLKSSAILYVLKQLPMSWPLLYGLIVLPGFIRDGIYGFIGQRRYKWFGRGEACYLPGKEDQDRFL